MKYISLIVFAAALIWTWHIVHEDSGISFETHSGIQEKLAELISTNIKTKRPTASEVVVEKIWTEAIDDHKVKAFFVYSFKDNNAESGVTTSRIKGEGLLEEQADNGSGEDRWALTKVHTDNDAIQFDDATIITGSASGSPETPAEAPTDKASEEHK